MSPLEIVLVTVLGGLVLVAVFYVLIVSTNKNSRLQLFKVINDEAIKGGTIFLGDSLTDFFPIQDFFPERLIYNRGIAADTTKDVIARLDDVLTLQPKKIFVQIGTNDLGKWAKPKNVVKRIEFIYNELMTKVPGVKIYAISLYPVSHRKMWLSPVIAGLRSNRKIKETNRLLNALCEKKKIPYIDMFSVLIDQKGRMNKHYTLEGLHMSGLGYKAIADTLYPYID